MMTTPVPKSILNEIQKMQMAFIWGDDENGREMCAVNQEIVIMPKCLGGLGLRWASANFYERCLLTEVGLGHSIWIQFTLV